MDSIKTMSVDRTVVNRPQHILRRQEVMFEKLWSTATQFKKRFKDMSSFKQNQVICLVQLIISSLKSSRKSTESSGILNRTSRRTNNKTIKQGYTLKNHQKNLEKNEVKFSKTGQSDINNETSSLTECSLNCQEKVSTTDNFVDNIKIEFDHIDCKTETEEVDFNDVFTAVEIEDNDPFVTNEETNSGASPSPPKLEDSTRHQHDPEESSAPSKKLVPLLPLHSDSSTVLVVVGPHQSTTPVEAENPSRQHSPGGRHISDLTPSRLYVRRPNHTDNPAYVTDSNDYYSLFLPQEVEVVPSDRGTLYIADGYIFMANRTFTDKGVMYVKCKVHSCPSRGSFSSNDPHMKYSAHNHPPSEIDVEVLHMKAELKRLAMMGSRTPKEIFNDVSKRFPKASTRIGYKTIRSTLYRYVRLNNSARYN